MRRLLLALVLIVSACGGAATTADTSTTLATMSPSTLPVGGPTEPGIAGDLDEFFAGIRNGVDAAVVDSVGASGDERLAWVLTDLLRFLGPGADRDRVVAAFEQVTGTDLVGDGSAWVESTDLLIGRDTPAPAEYVRWKGALYSAVEERWAPVFEEPTVLDYRLLGWGGVLPDDRPQGDTELPCV
ncbi:MAG: hypothetical protein HKO87_06630, partial [Acidimicrobiia bacterium]|nr:hypothetical protein [Acidimicrobiia bacterium]